MNSEKGFLLIPTLFFIAILSLSLTSLWLLLTLQNKEVQNQCGYLQVDTLAQNGWKCQNLVANTLPDSPDKTTVLANARKIYQNPNHPDYQLYLAKNSNAVYSVGISQNGQFRAVYKKTLSTGKLEKW